MRNGPPLQYIEMLRWGKLDAKHCKLYNELTSISINKERIAAKLYKVFVQRNACSNSDTFKLTCNPFVIYLYRLAGCVGHCQLDGLATVQNASRTPPTPLHRGIYHHL
jgi:hypothetical protein